MKPNLSIELLIIFIVTLTSCAGVQPEINRTEPGKDADSYSRRGDSLMQKSRETMDIRLYEEAESAYERALAIDPNHEAAMVGLAWVHNSEHDFDGGRMWAEKALLLNPALPDAYALLGDAAVELGNYDEAFDHYQKAMDLRPIYLRIAVQRTCCG